jgi:hypothetical protein
VDSIRKVKPRRQMIFVTHNPNIPVLGDAKRVFVLDSDGASAHKANLRAQSGRPAYSRRRS